MYFAKLLARWLPFAIVVVLICGTIYFVGQQVYRQSADDAVARLAADAVARLESGDSPEDIVGEGRFDAGASPAPFLVIFDRDARPVAYSATVGAMAPKPPSGVIERARERGENRVTWQPQSGLRYATVGIAANSGYVAFAAQSLAETEARIARLGWLIAIAFVLGLAGTFGAVWLGNEIDEQIAEQEAS